MKTSLKDWRARAVACCPRLKLNRPITSPEFNLLRWLCSSAADWITDYAKETPTFSLNFNWGGEWMLCGLGSDLRAALLVPHLIGIEELLSHEMDLTLGPRGFLTNYGCYRLFFGLVSSQADEDLSQDVLELMPDCDLILTCEFLSIIIPYAPKLTLQPDIERLITLRNRFEAYCHARAYQRELKASPPGFDRA